MKKKILHVAVLMGGFSKEKKVSLNTGKACSNALKQANYQVSEIVVDKNLLKNLLHIKPDVCFNALHGSYGEDGNVQGLLNTLKIPYTHSGLTASSIAMNKLYTKSILTDFTKKNKNPIIFPKNLFFKNHEEYKNYFPVVVKPISGGSSVDIKIFKDIQKLKKFMPKLIKDNYIIEPYVGDKELTVAVLKNKPLTVTEILPKNNEFYNYKSKYVKNSSLHLIPAKIPNNIFNLAMDWALQAHDILGCKGITRTDFRYDSKNKELFMLEINTQPGMTETSLVPEQANYFDLTMVDIVKILINEAKYQKF